MLIDLHWAYVGIYRFNNAALRRIPYYAAKSGLLETVARTSLVSDADGLDFVDGDTEQVKTRARPLYALHA